MTKIEKAIMKEILLKLEKKPMASGYWDGAGERSKSQASLDEKSVKEGIQMLKATLSDPQAVYNSLDIVEKK